MLELEAWLTKGEQRIVIEKDRVLRGIHKDIRVSQTPLPCSAIETQDYNLVFHKAMPEKGDVLVAHKPWWKGLAGCSTAILPRRGHSMSPARAASPGRAVRKR